MFETYVKIITKHKPKDMPPTYCPIDIEKNCMTIGLSLIGFYPKGAVVVGTYNEDTETLRIYKKYKASFGGKTK